MVACASRDAEFRGNDSAAHQILPMSRELSLGMLLTARSPSAFFGAHTVGRDAAGAGAASAARQEAQQALVEDEDERRAGRVCGVAAQPRLPPPQNPRPRSDQIRSAIRRDHGRRPAAPHRQACSGVECANKECLHSLPRAQRLATHPRPRRGARCRARPARTFRG